MNPRPHVLIVEATGSGGDPLAAHLVEEGFAASRVQGVTAVLRALRANDAVLVLLDVGVVDGLQFCRRIRAESSVPIVLLVAHAREADRVLALDLGADDVVTKPFSPVELAARIRAILRRGDVARTRALEIGDIRLDPAARRVTKGGTALALAPRQFDLLHVLMRSAGTVVRRDRLMNDVWDSNWPGSTKTLDVHIAWLRAKIEDDPSHPRYITTLRGIGFRFASPGELADAV
jgi:DNA-binding response OmpR family regulator